MEAGAPKPDSERTPAARRRAVRRRRRVALGGLVAVAALAVAAVVGLGGGSAKAPDPAPAKPLAAAGPSVKHERCLAPYHVEAAPILEYHVIAQAPAGAPYPLLYVSPKLFGQQMEALAAAGYHAVTLDQLWANWHQHKRLPCGKPIVISFDNGYETQFQYAAPVLAKLGWAGVENLQLYGLDWANGGISHHEIRELIKAGWELDTQGWDHADMVTQTASGLALQIVDARRRLRRWFHVPVNWFCYPSGQYDRTVIGALEAAGFRGSTTEYYGWASPRDDPYALPRLEVHPTLSGPELVPQVAAMRDDPPPGDSYVS
jgi:peptidoglycan/xylan/chitin deacetylase (PgdA/CDA1 family)